MEKRVIIAVVLCVGILVLWQQLFPAPHAPPPPPAATSPNAAAPGSSSLPNLPPAATPTPAGGAPATAPGAGTAPVAAEQLVELMTPAVRFVLSSYGGTLRQVQLREPKYLLTKGDPGSGLQLVRTTRAEHAPMRTTFPSSAFATPADPSWTVSRPAADTVLFVSETEDVRIEKRYQVEPASYRLHLDVTVQNKSAKPQDQHLAIHVFGWQDPSNKGGGFLSGPSATLASALCQVDDKTHRDAIEKLEKPVEYPGLVKWIAADEKFFITAAVPFPETPPRSRKCTVRSPQTDIGESVLLFDGRSLAPQASTSYAFTVFSGPKVISELEKVQPAGQDAQLGNAVDVTLAILSRPILSLLKFFYSYTHNWGVAIILLTLFIKLVTFYPTQKALLSGKKMQKLGPKMAAIRKKYENDRQRQSVETMNLYKSHGVSPFGGCLPSLIQMPIWIALYSTLNYAVELYRSPFMGHIHDLTAKDPFYVTPLLMGVVMYTQMRMSPASPDAQQQKMMTIMMPLMFTAFSLVLPSGLALYMLTSYLIGILQQLVVNRIDRKASGAAA
jgi:YidC/Oxa1 family membrane protein insertase